MCIHLFFWLMASVTDSLPSKSCCCLSANPVIGCRPFWFWHMKLNVYWQPITIWSTLLAIAQILLQSFPDVYEYWLVWLCSHLCCSFSLTSWANVFTSIHPIHIFLTFLMWPVSYQSMVTGAENIICGLDLFQPDYN